MTINEKKDYIKSQEPTFLPAARHNGYVCPACGNGGGRDGDGIIRQPGGYGYHCFKCGLHEDIFGLIGKTFDLQGFKEQYAKGCELYGIDNDTMTMPQPIQTAASAADHPQSDEPETDYTEQYRKWNKAINEPGNPGLLYLQGRGITLDMINRFNIGYATAWKHPKVERNDKISASPRVIIPTSSGSYLARDIRPNADIPEAQQRYKKLKVGHSKMFNTQALNTDGNVFVVEGEIDAMSIIAAGDQAVGIGSASNVNAFIKHIKEHGANCRLTIIPDNDNNKAGSNAADKLCNELRKTNMPFHIQKIPDEYKDVNELYTSDKEKLMEIIKEANEYKEEVRPEAFGIEPPVPTSQLLQKFINEVAQRKPSYSTGFADLDEALGGGLREDLYTIMAGTGIGKTSFVLQIADQVAQQGGTVLFYNLEMANNELIARSISRETYKTAIADFKSDMHALSALNVLSGDKYKDLTDTKRAALKTAIENYANYCGGIYYHEALGYYDTGKIDNEVRYFVKKDGKAPVIIVDYLQMLSLGITLSEDKKNLTERQAIDKAIYDLKSISRKYNAPVIALSSVNRDSQKGNKVLTQESGKESGGIEYTAGTVMSLDYTTRGSGDFNEEAEAQSYPRRVSLYIHKNRYGVPKQSLDFDYYSRYNFFFPTYSERKKY